MNFPDGDLFFQQFEALAFDARILGNDRMMMAQVKKACREMSKNTIYAGDGTIPATHPQWKSRLLRINYNWQLKKAEGTAGQRLADAKTQTQKAAMPQKGSQQLTAMPEKKMATGTTYGGQGALMDIDRTHAKVKCFGCRKLGHFKCDCPDRPTTREEVLRKLNYYWDHHPMEEKTESKVEEVKDSTKQ